MKDSPRILFLTTHNLATNPRIVKEIRLAIENNFQVEIICFEFNNWSYSLNQTLKFELEGKGAVLHILQAGKNPFKTWFKSVAFEKWARFLSYFISLKNNLLSVAVSRRSKLLVTALEKIAGADWVLGHNPGALYVTQLAAKKFNCKSGFDIEDYHPGEGNDLRLQQLTRQLMQQVLPTMNYVSFAAPLIMQKVKEDINYDSKKWFTLLNYFPSAEFKEPGQSNGSRVKMVWFSQHVTAGRGLENILPFVKIEKDDVELHLIGNMDTDFYRKELKHIMNIIIHKPLGQRDLHFKLSEFDIGLSLDTPLDENRKFTITNKLLAYLQAGVFVVATDTAAQEEYLNEYPLHGVCFGIRNNMNQVLGSIIQNIEAIRSRKKERYAAFKNLNAETESLRLLMEWRD